MAYYSPDHNYIEGKKVIDTLDPNNEREALILYFLKKQQEFIDEQNKRLAEYQEVFNMISKFLPNNNSRIYGI